MGETHPRLALLLAGLRWRAGSSIALLAVAVAGVAAGAFGPMYLRGADQSVLDATLDGAPVGNAGLTLTSPGTTDPGALVAGARQVPHPAGGGRWFGVPIVTGDVGVVTTGTAQSYGSDVVSRTGACAHLDVVAGKCTGAGSVTMSTRTATRLGVRVGGVLEVSAPGSHSVALRIGGLYRPGDPADPYWWGANYFPFGSTSGAPRSMPLVDTIFASPATLAVLTPTSRISFMVQLPYERGSLEVADVGELQDALARSGATLGRSGVVVGTQLPALLDHVSGTEQTMATVVAVVDLELVLLAVFVLYFVASRTAAQRDPDVRLADLRGFRTRGTIAVALAEPLAIVLVAVPLGVAAAWVGTSLVAPYLFGSSVHAALTPLVVVAALGTGLVGAAATALGAGRSVGAADGAPGDDTAQGPTSRARRARVVTDAAVIALAGAAFAELSIAGVSSGVASDRTDPLAAFAPGLLALAVGVLGARALPVALRGTFPLTRYSSHVATALGTRRVARRREFAAELILVTVAVGLATFGVSGWAVASRNRATRSEFDVGAWRVLTVAPRPGVKFLSAVRAADGEGRSAMAVVVERASDGTTLAVDSTRMASVISWPAGLGAGGAAASARRLVPPKLAAPVSATGTELSVTVDARIDAAPPPQLAVDVFDDAYQSSTTVPLGPLRDGDGEYVGSLQGACGSGCHVVDLSLIWNPPGLGEADGGGTGGPVSLVVHTMAVRTGSGAWTPLSAGLHDTSRWTSLDGGVVLRSSAAGLSARVPLSAFAPSSFGPADVPARLPAVVTPLSAGSGIGTGGLSLVGLDGGTVDGQPVGEVPALPRVGASASLVDLGVAQRFISGPFLDDTPEVWLNQSAPADIVRRLAARGIVTVSSQRADRFDDALTHQGVSFAYTLFLLAAIAAMVLAVGATAFTVAAGARQRSGELAAMRAVGVDRPVLGRSVVVEHALTVGCGLILGLGAGAVASAVTLRSVPEFAVAQPGPPLALGLPWTALVLVVGGLIVALGVTVGIGATVVAHQASMDKLGGASA